LVETSLRENKMKNPLLTRNSYNRYFLFFTCLFILVSPHFSMGQDTPTCTATATLTPIVTPPAGLLPPLSLNLCGPEYVSSSTGITWLADQAYSPGGFGQVDSGDDCDFPSAVSGTLDAPLYQTMRCAPVTMDFEYQFDNLPWGDYQVLLKFMEPECPVGSGTRVTNILGNGMTVIQNLDITSAVGCYGALDQIFNVAVTNGSDGYGSLNLKFVPISYAPPVVSAIQVAEYMPKATPTPTPTGAWETPTPTVSPTFTLTPSWTCTETTTQTPTCTATIGPPSFPLYLAAARSQPYVSSFSGITWIADQAYFPGGFGYNTSAAGLTYVTTVVNGTADPLLYQTMRCCRPNLEYRFDGIPPGLYQVTLKFIEPTPAWMATRIFSVLANGTTVIENLDIFAETGGSDLALDKTFSVTVTAGADFYNSLDLQFVKVSVNGSWDEPLVSAIQIDQVRAEPTPSYSGSRPPSAGECFIYPSPVRGGKASVCCRMAEAGEMNLKIWNEAAELITEVKHQLPAGVRTTQFNLSGLSSGIYFYAVTLKYDSGKVETIKPQKFAVIR
jgi:hypothetical protein